MSAWKQIKNNIKKAYNAGSIKVNHVYEINYDHVFFRLDSRTVYDVIDCCAYRPQTGTV